MLELGRVARAQHDSTTALRCYEQVIRLTPERVHAEPYVGASEQLRRLGELDRAEACLERGLAICDSDPAERAQILGGVALLSICRGQVADAVDMLTRIIAQTKDHKIVVEAAELLAASGEVTEALDLVKRVQPIARAHCLDVGSYDKYIQGFSEAVSLTKKIDDRMRYDRSAQQLTLKPQSPRREWAIDTFPDLNLACPPPTSLYSMTRKAFLSADATLPVADAGIDDGSNLFGSTLRWTDAAHFTHVLPDAHIFDSLGDYEHRSLVIYDTDKFVPRLAAFYYPAATARVAVRDARRTQEPPIELAFVLPSIGGWRNYNHAIVDIFSPLTIYESLGLSCPIVTPGPLRGWHWDILRATGIDTGVIVSGDDVRDRTIRCAICPERVHGSLLKEWCHRIARNVVSASPSHGQKPRLLYVSRANASLRSMSNESELEDALANQLGAAIVRMENLSFEAQVRLAHQADLIIGPHGAGLTNVVFARPGSWLVELLPRRHVVDLYRRLAADCGVRYAAIAGDVDNLDHLTWRIDLERTVGLVDQIVRRVSNPVQDA